MPPLARRNLFHDKVRLAVTLTGVVFAVVLIVVELGLLAGFTMATSGLIDHSNADLWVTSKHVPYIELGALFSERKMYQVLAVPGVAEAQKFITEWTQWQCPDGRAESVQIVGINPDSQLGRPWNLVEGNVEDLETPHAIIPDEIYKTKLGVTRIGEVFEINHHRARVVGFTHGIRAFTTTPYVFTTFKNVQDYASLPLDQTVFVQVRVVPGVDIEQVRQGILERVKDVYVLTNSQFSHMTEFYRMFTTGAGVAVLLAALLGAGRRFRRGRTNDLCDHHGSPERVRHSQGDGRTEFLHLQGDRTQAAMSAVMGYVLGMIVSVFLVHASQEGGASILLPWPMAIGMFFVTQFMCVGAATVSITKVTSLDPAMVFEG